MIDENRVKTFFDRFPLVIPVIEGLQKNALTWIIGGSGCLYLLGNERLPDDVDIFLPDNEHDLVDKLFTISSFTYTSKTENVRNSNYQGNHSIQFTSHLVITIDNEQFPLAITNTVVEKRKTIFYGGKTLYLLPPEDVLLIKAILQRGADVGKNDVEDIQIFLKNYPDLDMHYLEKRIKETHAEKRVGSLFAS